VFTVSSKFAAMNVPYRFSYASSKRGHNPISQMRHWAPKLADDRSKQTNARSERTMPRPLQ